MKENSKYKLRKNRINIAKKAIQYGLTRNQFYIQILMESFNLDFWTDLLQSQAR